MLGTSRDHDQSMPRQPRPLSELGADVAMFQGPKGNSPLRAAVILGQPQAAFLRTSRRYVETNIENYLPVIIVRYVGAQIDQRPVMTRLRSRSAILPMARRRPATTGGA